MSAYLSLIWRRRGGRLLEAGRLLTFSAFRMGAYSRLGAYSNKYGITKIYPPNTGQAETATTFRLEKM